MGLQESGFIMDGVRLLFGFLDKLVYSLIKWILFGIFDLANLTTSTSAFSGVYQRLYIILGIFMAFKLSFSFFQYIIDPESMTGKSEKSLSKLFSRTFVMLAALVFLPTLLFGSENGEGYLAKAQKAFLPSLPKIIFGVENVGGLSTKDAASNSKLFTDSIDQAADDITMTVLKGFFAPSPELDSVCKVDKVPEIEKLDDFSKYINYTCNRRGDLVIDIGIVHTGTKYYVFSYMWFISTVVGVLVVALLLGITLSIAKRIFKLLVLEIMAPIPIMSLMDPKGSKDGAFRKWIKSLISTFGDIFMKLGLVYMIIVFIHMIVASGDKSILSGLPKEGGFRGTYLTILLILGLIFFAKEAPKFIKESLGFKGDSAGLFDDVKSVGKAAGLVGGAAVGTAGVIGSAVGNIRAQHAANVAENKDENGNEKPKSLGRSLLHGARNVGAALSGAVGGTAAAAGALTKKDAGIKSVMKAQQERNQMEFDRRRHGQTMFGSIGAAAQTMFTGYTPYEKMEVEWTKMEDQAKAEEAKLKPMQDANARRKSIMDRVNSKTEESDKTSGTYKTRDGKEIKGNYRAYNSAFVAAKAGFGVHHKMTNTTTGATIAQADYDALSEAEKSKYIQADYFDFDGQEINMSQAEDIRMGLLDENKEDYYRQAYATRKDGADAFDKSIANDIAVFEKSHGKIETTLSTVKAEFGNNNRAINEKSSQINNTREQISNERNKFAAQRKKANSNKYSARKGGK